MHRMDMTGLLERRVAAAAIFAESRFRFQRPSARQSSASCAAAAVVRLPRRPRAHGCHQSRCEQAQSGGRPMIESCARPRARPLQRQRPTAAKWSGKGGTTHANTPMQCRGFLEEQRWWRVARRRAHPGFKIPCCERPVSEEPLFGKLSVHFCTLALTTTPILFYAISGAAMLATSVLQTPTRVSS
jgi:hypothetical protein